MQVDSHGLVPRWGATHIHTDHSDGGVTVSHAADAARRSGLDFIHITDHNTLGAREDEGYLDDVLVLVDVEVSPSTTANHVVALGLDEYQDSLHGIQDPVECLQAIRDLGGFAWVPHPMGFNNPWFRLWSQPWEAWTPLVSGMEIGTFCVDWAMGLRPWNLLKKLRGESTPGELRPDPALVELWERLNSEREIPIHGFVGLDAHFKSRFGGRLRTPSYEFLFGTYNLVVWTPPPTGDGENDAKALRAALKAGMFVNVMGNVAEREPVLFESGREGLRLVAPEHPGTSIRLFRNGAPLQQISGSSLELHDPREGLYRAEVLRDNRLWAVTNPYRVTTVAVPDPTTASA